jgi:A/G-specific adenine glycosylase
VRWIARTTGLSVVVVRKVTTVHHTYTHFKLRMEVLLCHWTGGRVRLNGPAAFQWVPLGRLEVFPLHKAVHKALPAVERSLGRGATETCIQGGE